MTATHTIILASSNAHKVQEIQAGLDGLAIRIQPQSDFGVDSCEEPGLAFIENAILKARHASKITGLPAIADDSGLVVDALNGAPGVRSARYAGKGASDSDNNAKLLDALKAFENENRAARFHCAMVYLSHFEDPMPVICQGTWEGSILQTPSGKHGFGYDPIFYVPTHHCSSAELLLAEKNKISHRGIAMGCLQRYLREVAEPLDASE